MWKLQQQKITWMVRLSPPAACPAGSPGWRFCVNGNHGNQIYRIKMEKFMIKTSLHKEKWSRSRISRKGKFCALRFQRYIFWWFFDDCYNLYKNTDPLLENSAYTVFGLVLPEVASQTNVAAELKQWQWKWQNLGCDIDNDNNKQPWLWYRKWKNLKVLDGLLPVPSEAVDYTGGKTIHKPGILNVKFLTKIVIFIWLRL